MLAHLWIACQPFGLATPYAQHEPLTIRSVQGPSTCPKLTIEELAVDASATYQNPFDPAEVALDADVFTPSGVKLQIPGFIYQDFDRSLKDGVETLVPKGAATWRLRLTPTEVGHYKVLVKLQDGSGKTTSKPFEFDSVPSDAVGFPRVSANSTRYFQNLGGEGLFPVGVNLFWAGPRGTYDYDDWLAKAAQNGLNLQRLLLNSSQSTFALERPGKPQDGLGPGLFNLADCWKLDHVLETARKSNIYSIFTLDQSNELNIRGTNPDWDHNVLNQDNGGPLRVWTEFWSNPKCDRLYKNRLRYLVARYSADPKLFAWELWRDVDQVQEYDALQTRAWHARIAAELRKLDPYLHLVTTGFASPGADRDTYLLKGIDFSEMRMYSPRPVGEMADQITRRAEWGKPTLVTETAIDRTSPHDAEDPSGVQVHDPLWASVATGAAGGALPWWWDGLIDKNNLWPLLGVVSKFTEGIDFGKEQFRATDAELAFISDKESVPNRDLVLDQGPESWTASISNRPQIVNVVGDHILGSMPSRILHGVKAHPELHNPVTMIVNEGMDSKLVLDVGRFSRRSGADLQVTVDGMRALDQAFPPQTDGPSSDYQGRFSIPLTKGAHQVIIENTGPDWLELEYRIAGVIAVKTPPANIWSLVGNGTAVAWVQQRGWNWQTAVQEKQTFNPVPPCTASLNDLASGTWDCQVWDTWKGLMLAKTAIVVGLEGKANVSLPSFTSDLAIKMVRRK